MRNKRGQITIFVIIAVIVVALALLIFILIPGIRENREKTSNPQQYIDFCVREELESNIEKISLQGGQMEPEGYFTYNYIPIKYLCYTNEPYTAGVVQESNLKSSIEKEISNSIQEAVDECFTLLKEDYEERGYIVEMNKRVIETKLFPKVIVSSLGYSVTIEKDDVVNYEDFDIIVNNNLYELLNVVDIIINQEVLMGPVYPEQLMMYYPNLIVKENLREDYTKIFTIEDREKGNKFQFASKSGALIPIY
jgi:hypothetical protein